MYEELPCNLNLVLELEYVHSAQAYYIAFTFEGNLDSRALLRMTVSTGVEIESLREESSVSTGVKIDSRVSIQFLVREI